jgi:hypothetical protein
MQRMKVRREKNIYFVLTSNIMAFYRLDFVLTSNKNLDFTNDKDRYLPLNHTLKIPS